MAERTVCFLKLPVVWFGCLYGTGCFCLWLLNVSDLFDWCSSHVFLPVAFMQPPAGLNCRALHVFSVWPFINQLLCTTLCIPNHIIVSALTHFSVYCGSRNDDGIWYTQCSAQEVASKWWYRTWWCTVCTTLGLFTCIIVTKVCLHPRMERF
jgi:hypothetical protein